MVRQTFSGADISCFIKQDGELINITTMDSCIYSKDYVSLTTPAIRGSMVVSIYSIDFFEEHNLDPLKPFDLYFSGANPTGVMSEGLLGILIHEQTGGISNNDLGSNVGYSFSAQEIMPRLPIPLELRLLSHAIVE